MKASELIEKIHNNEIREGTKIICHKKNKYFDYEFTRYFMGNWFSKVPAEQHTGDDDFDKDMILELCDRSVTYSIVDESKDNSIERLDIEEDAINRNERFIRKEDNKFVNLSVADYELAKKINELIDEVNKLKEEYK